MRDDGGYYRKRVAEELAAAARATCPQAVAAHQEMARLYSGRLDALSPAGTEELTDAHSA